MALPANSSIKLDIHSPKKDAVVATPGTAAGATELRIWAAANIDPGATQSTVGTFWVLFRWAKSNMKALTGGPAVVHAPLGATEAQVELNGTPTADECRLEIGSGVHTGDKSHFMDRTFKRLIEAWLQATAKNSGVGAQSPGPINPGGGTVTEVRPNEYLFAGAFAGETRFVFTYQRADMGQAVTTQIQLPPNPLPWTTAQTVGYLRGEIDNMAGLTALATNNTLIVQADDLSEPFSSSLGIL